MTERFANLDIAGLEDIDQQLDAIYASEGLNFEPHTPPAPEIPPVMTEMILTDIGLMLNRVSQQRRLSHEGSYYVATSPIQTRILEPSESSRSMHMRVAKHEALKNGGSLASPETVSHYVTYHETSYGNIVPQPVIVILFRTPELDVPVFWQEPVNEEGQRDTSLTEQMAAKLWDDLRDGPNFRQAALRAA